MCMVYVSMCVYDMFMCVSNLMYMNAMYMCVSVLSVYDMLVH